MVGDMVKAPDGTIGRVVGVVDVWWEREPVYTVKQSDGVIFDWCGADLSEVEQ
jgi:hypothetical protein